MLNNPFYYFGAFYANFGSFSAINKASGKQQAYRAGEFPSCNVTEARRSRVRRGRMRSRGTWRGTHARRRPVAWDARAAEARGVGRMRGGGPRGGVSALQPAHCLCSAENERRFPKRNQAEPCGTMWQSVRAGVTPLSERRPKVTSTGGPPVMGSTAWSCRGHRGTRSAAHAAAFTPGG